MLKPDFRLALLSDGIPPFVMGGMQKHSQLLVEFAAKSGIHVLLYHCVDKGTSVSDNDVLDVFSPEARTKIEVRTFEYEDTGWFLGHYVRAQDELSKRYFERLITETPVDFIYTKGFVGSYLLRHRKELGFSCPIGVKFHGMNMFQAQANWKGELTKHLLRGPVKRIMHAADYVFSYGGKITEIIVDQGIDRSKVVEIATGVSNDWISDKIQARGNERTRFLFVGRYDRVKGLPELYQAIERIKSDAFVLDLVGPIPEENQLQDDRVVYSGKLSGDELKEAYDRSDVLLCPSISEGMPNVILEAMARGLAVIATDVGATAALVTEENGVLLSHTDVGLIQQAMKQAISWSGEELDTRKEASQRRIRESFTWEQIVTRLIAFLKSSTK